MTALALLVLAAGCRWDREESMGPLPRREAAPALRPGPAEPLFAPPRAGVPAWGTAPAPAVQAEEPRVLPAAPVVPLREDPPLSPATMSGKDLVVDLKVLERHFDNNRVYFTLLLRNTSAEGVRVRLFSLGYDRNGRLVETNDKTLYFQPREQMFQRYNFRRNSGITRWVFTLR